MFSKIEHAISYIKTKKIEEVDFKYVGLAGRWHHITFPARTVTKTIFLEGVGIDVSSIEGFGNVENADAVVIPDISTAFLDCCKQVKTISFICNVCDCLSMKPLPCCTRGIAQKAENYLRRVRVADALNVSPEFEFHIFDKISLSLQDTAAHFKVSSKEFSYERRNSSYGVRKGEGYHIEEPFDSLHEIRSRIAVNLRDVNVKVKYHHHESGGPAQVEIEVFFKPLVDSADDILKTKYVIRNVVNAYGKVACFLPKPLNNMSGNGMHMHLFLVKKRKSLFYQKGGREGLSDKAIYFIGGIIKHGRALTALACGSTNSFRRLIPGYEAPVYFSYSLANRSAAIRIPKYVKGSKEKRFEFRISDATCNPYLLLSSLLLAGIEGIHEKIDPGKPSNVNLYKGKAKGLVPLPTSFHEALDALNSDRAFLKQGDVFSDEVIDKWIEIKKRGIQEIRSSVHPKEFEMYNDI
jgi:glutamine synthetase